MGLQPPPPAVGTGAALALVRSRSDGEDEMPPTSAAWAQRGLRCSLPQQPSPHPWGHSWAGVATAVRGRRPVVRNPGSESP